MRIAGWMALMIIGCTMLNPEPGYAEESFRSGSTLPLDQCIAIALQRQPEIRAGLMDVEASRARIGQARAGYLPQVQAQVLYDRYSPESDAAHSSKGEGSYHEYTSQMALSQNLYDFGKTSSQVRIQRLGTEAFRLDAENLKDEIVFDVKRAYFEALQARRNRDLAEEMVDRYQQHLDQAKGFFNVGAKPRFDVTKAEVDLGSAKLGLIRAENALRIARVRLNNAMGYPQAPNFKLEDNLDYVKETIVFDEVLARAYQNRSDLLSVGNRRQSFESSIDLARTGYYPEVTGQAYYRWIGEGFPVDDEWQVGVAVTFPLFTGLRTRHQVMEAEANLEAAKAREQSLRQLIFLEVQQAYLNLQEAEEKIPLAELTVRKGAENLDIADGRYRAEVGNLIEVTDAQVAYSNARNDLNQALCDFHIARAALQKAEGAR
jgi:outer membrane protein TolC